MLAFKLVVKSRSHSHSVSIFSLVYKNVLCASLMFQIGWYGKSFPTILLFIVALVNVQSGSQLPFCMWICIWLCLFFFLLSAKIEIFSIKIGRKLEKISRTHTHTQMQPHSFCVNAPNFITKVFIKVFAVRDLPIKLYYFHYKKKKKFLMNENILINKSQVIVSLFTFAVHTFNAPFDDMCSISH